MAVSFDSLQKGIGVFPGFPSQFLGLASPKPATAFVAGWNGNLANLPRAVESRKRHTAGLSACRTRHMAEPRTQAKPSSLVSLK
jgi:hypothetical protein